MRTMKTLMAVCAIAGLAQWVTAAPVTTELTYQGKLEHAGAPANGNYDFRFRLYDANAGGVQVGPSLYRTIAVQQGLFTAHLDFGDVYHGDQLWLRIEVRPSGGGAYTILSPRQELMACAHASWARLANDLALPFAGTSSVDDTPVFDIDSQGLGNLSYAIRGVRGTAGNLMGNYPVIIGSSSTHNIGVAGTGASWGVAGFVDEDYGRGIQGEVSSGTVGAEAIAAVNFAASTYAYLGTDEYSGDFDGDVRFRDMAYKEYTYGTIDPAIPIAYGFINGDGSVAAATPNVSSTYNAGSSRYEITIAGESYFFDEYVTVVTSVGTPPRIATTSSVGGDLLVYLRDLSGNPTQYYFQFTTYKPTGNAVRLDLPRAVPTPENPGITDSDLIEQLGVKQVQDAVPTHAQPREPESAAMPQRH